MGLANERIYLDSCIVIYVVEEVTGYVEHITTAIEKKVNAQFCISPLVQMECLVGVLKQQKNHVQMVYKQFFNCCTILDITSETFTKTATQLRVQHGLKTPDAIHLATALEYDCQQFWTNDNRLNDAAGERAVNLFRSHSSL